jgi:hypothetical protein
VWNELQIKPTKDERAIRRAYADRLRALDPDRDPAAFLRLRAAYERALAMAAAAARKEQPRPGIDVAPHAETLVPSAPAMELLPPPAGPASHSMPLLALAREPTPEERDRVAAVQDIDAALSANDALAALVRLNSSLAKGQLHIADREYFLENIMRRAVQDHGIGPRPYLQLLHEVGWDIIPGAREVVTPARRAALSRADAERWYLDMQAKAARRYWIWNIPGVRKVRAAWRTSAQDATGARVLLGGHSLRISPAGLKRVFSLYRHYGFWIAHRFEPSNVARAQAILEREKWLRPIRRGFISVLIGICAVALVGALVAGGNPWGFLFLVLAFRLGRAVWNRMSD